MRWYSIDEEYQPTRVVTDQLGRPAHASGSRPEADVSGRTSQETQDPTPSLLEFRSPRAAGFGFAAAYTPISLSQDSARAGRRRVFFTAQGSRLEPFGWVEWALLCGVALIWGSSFLLIEIGLESLEPATITWVRVALGFLVLTVFPAARKPVERADYPRVVLLGFIWVVVPFLLFPIAQQHIDSALAGMLNASVPILSAAVAAVLAAVASPLAPSCRHSARARRDSLHRPARGGRLLRRGLGSAPRGGGHHLLRVRPQPGRPPPAALRSTGDDVQSARRGGRRHRAVRPGRAGRLALGHRAGPGSHSPGSGRHRRRVRDHGRAGRQSQAQPAAGWPSTSSPSSPWCWASPSAPKSSTHCNGPAPQSCCSAPGSPAAASPNAPKTQPGTNHHPPPAHNTQAPAEADCQVPVPSPGCQVPVSSPGVKSRCQVPVSSPGVKSRCQVPVPSPGAKSRCQVRCQVPVPSPGAKSRCQVPVSSPGCQVPVVKFRYPCYRLAPVAVLHTGTAQQAVAAYAVAAGQPFTSSRMLTGGETGATEIPSPDTLMPACAARVGRHATDHGSLLSGSAARYGRRSRHGGVEASRSSASSRDGRDGGLRRRRECRACSTARNEERDRVEPRVCGGQLR